MFDDENVRSVNNDDDDDETEGDHHRERLIIETIVWSMMSEMIIS